jgi:hypothetical protein
VSYSEDIRTIMKRDLFGEQNDAYHKCEECGWNIGCFDEWFRIEDSAKFYLISCLFSGV